MTSPVLVNGASGTLGSRLCQLLDRRGLPYVRGVRRATDLSGAKEIIIDSDGNAEPGRLAGCRAIINCAGVVRGSVEDLTRSNVRHALTLAVEAKRVGVPTFVQVASFSAYGLSEVIDRNSIEAPDSDYGRSKLEADRDLHRLANDRFKVVSVRLPFMFDRYAPGVVGGLVSTFRKLPAFPVSARSVGRSIISYDHAAAELLAAAETGPSRIVCAADPTPFRYERLCELMKAEGMSPARLVRVPAAVQGLLRLVSPKAANRLFQSSILATEFNAATALSSDNAAETHIIALLRNLRDGNA